MTSRFLSGSMKDYLAKYRTKTGEKRINFMNYLRTQRSRIIERERQKLVKRIVFWGLILGGSFLIYDEIYRKKVQINKMNSKLQNFYSAIMLRESLKEDVSCITLAPKTLDELANIVSLAYRYHFKVIVRMDEMTKREKIIISEKFVNKCLILNLSSLDRVRIDEENHTVYAETGTTCGIVNSALEERGYAPLFPQELRNQAVYNAITNNLPLNHGEFNKEIINLELVSASGKNFRSAGQTNRYGQIPSLNPLFIGTGGVFAIPTAANIRISKKELLPLGEEHLKIEIKDVNEKIVALRKLNALNNQLIDMQISGSITRSDDEKGDLFVTCKERYPVFKENLDICQKICKQKGIPLSPAPGTISKRSYNLFFSVNNRIFQEFLLKFDKQLPYEYANGLLKVGITESENHQNHESYISVINDITSNSGVLVWCDIPEILLRIKPSLDSSEVGAELMRKIVQVRQGLDHRNILYSHSRYEDYFAKGLFRKLTEYFW